MYKATGPARDRKPAPVSFALVHHRPLKSTRLAYLLWAVGIFGCLGLHRFYLGKRKTALLWLCTAGIFTIGAGADAFLLKWLVKRHNRIIRLKESHRQLKEVQQHKQKAVEAQQFREAAALRDREVLLLAQVQQLKATLSHSF